MPGRVPGPRSYAENVQPGPPAPEPSSVSCGIRSPGPGEVGEGHCGQRPLWAATGWVFPRTIKGPVWLSRVGEGGNEGWGQGQACVLSDLHLPSKQYPFPK